MCGGVNEYSHLSAILVGAVGCLVYLLLQWVIPLLKGKHRAISSRRYTNRRSFNRCYRDCPTVHKTDRSLGLSNRFYDARFVVFRRRYITRELLEKLD